MLLVAVAFYAAASVGYLAAIPPGNVSPVWLPSGIALAAILLCGYVVAPGIWLGAFATHAQALCGGGAELSVALLAGGTIAVGATLQAVFGAFLIRRLTGTANPFDRIGDVFAFVVAAMVSVLVSPTVGVTSTMLAGSVVPAQYLYTWWTWWLGDLVGVIIVAPIVVLWRPSHQRLLFERPAELALVLLLILLVGDLIFGAPFLVLESRYPIGFLVIPLILWAAFRLDQGGVVLAMLLTTLLAVWGTYEGRGPFRGWSLNESLLLLQTFLAVVMVMGLALGASLFERKRAADAARYRALFENSRDIILLVNPDDGRIIDANTAAVEAYGYDREELFLRTIFDLRTQATSPPIETQMQTADHDGLLFETVHRRKDGSEFPVEVGSQGQTFGHQRILLSIIRDISQRQDAERELRESEERFRRFSQASFEGIVVSRDGVIIDANEHLSNILGYSMDELRGMEIRRFIHPEDWPWVVASLTEKPGLPYEVRTIHKDGHVGVAEVRGLDAPASGGAVRITAVHDISHLKRAEAELRRHREHLEELVEERTAQLQALNQELASFSYSVAHDLRAPLRSITGFSQILLKDYTERLDDRGRDFLQRSVNAGLRMAEIIDAMLALFQLSRAEMQRREVDLSAIAEQIIEDLASQAPDRRAELVIEPNVTAEGDRSLLRTVLENLLGNAWKFTAGREPARIEFGALRGARPTVYFVRDNGAGFDMAYADKLFKPFSRLHGQQEFSGVGIGLVTVERIVQRHGGRIWAEGELDRGATFYFTLAPEPLGDDTPGDD